MKTYPTINKNTISKPDLIVNNPTKPNSPKSLIYFTSIGSFFLMPCTCILRAIKTFFSFISMIPFHSLSTAI